MTSRAQPGRVRDATGTHVPQNVVIVGGGFAGVALAQRLERLLPKHIEIVVLSTENHLVFTPMLPEVVGRTVSPLQIVVAGRQLTRRARWLEARVVRIDREHDTAHYLRSDGSPDSLRYVQLVLACGTVANLDEIPGLRSRAYALKTIVDAIIIGNDVIGNFEAAATEPDAESRARLLTTVVIGGGFSGVELAGHLIDLMRSTHRLYSELQHEQPRVVLLHQGADLLPELADCALSEIALVKLRANGVEVRLQTAAESANARSIRVSTGERIETGLIAYTAGTDTHPLIKGLGLTLTKGRLDAGPDMRVLGTENLWALGDCARVPNAHDGRICPATAQFAVQQALQLADNLARVARHAATKSFSFRSRGMIASIGDRDAVAKVYGVKLSGFGAWCLWRGVYLAKLPTLSRKLEVAASWICSIPFATNIAQLRLSPTRPAIETSAADVAAPVKLGPRAG